MERNERQSKAQSETELIGLTALETLFLMVVVFPLLFVMWTLIFPSASAQFYYEVGNNPRAYICYERAVEKAKGEEEVNLRIKCVNLALVLAEESSEYNEEIIEHTEKFLFSDECLERAVKIDDYSIVSTSPLLHPSLYGYADYLRECNAKARAKKNDFRVMVGKEYKTVEEVLALSPTAPSLLQLCAMLGVDDEIGASDTALCSYANDFLYDTVEGIEEEVTVENLYNLYAYGKMQQRIREEFAGSENKLATTINFRSSVYTHDELFRLLVKEYASNYND